MPVIIIRPNGARTARRLLMTAVALTACGSTTEPTRASDEPVLVFTDLGPNEGLGGPLKFSDPLGRDVRPLGPSEPHFQASVSPDGTRIARSTGLPPSDDFVEIVDVRDGSRRRLTPPGVPASLGLWAPDGARLLFQSAAPSPLGPAGLYVIGADGTGARFVGAYFPSTLRVSWAPDGTQIAFSIQTRLAGTQRAWPQIHVLPLAGGPARALRTPGSCGDTGPTWSPDNRRLAFVECSYDPALGLDQQRRRLVVMNADGSGAATPIHEQDGLRVPAWSPDGAWIAFEAWASVPGTAPPQSTYQVHVIPAAGGTARIASSPLTTHNGRPQWFRASARP